MRAGDLTIRALAFASAVRNQGTPRRYLQHMWPRISGCDRQEIDRLAKLAVKLDCEARARGFESRAAGFTFRKLWPSPLKACDGGPLFC